MPSLIEAPLRNSLRFMKSAVKSNPFFARLLYDVANADAFTPLEWHEKMLADTVRVESYREGIQRTVKPGDVVVDLGTGTGLLAFFAAAAGAKRVYAVDHSRFIDVAAEIGRRNGFNNIVFVPKNSRDFECPEPVDLIVHEQIGHALFDENMVFNLLDLKRRMLKPGGRILPARFKLFAAPMSLMPEHRRPFLWEVSVPGIDLSFLRNQEGLEEFRGNSHHYRLLANNQVESLLAPPELIAEVDLNRIGSDDEVAYRRKVSWRIDKDGDLEGVGFFFQVSFDDSDMLVFDTAPTSRQTSWQCQLMRADQQSVVVDEKVEFEFNLDPISERHRWRMRRA